MHNNINRLCEDDVKESITGCRIDALYQLRYEVEDWKLWDEEEVAARNALLNSINNYIDTLISQRN